MLGGFAMNKDHLEEKIGSYIDFLRKVYSFYLIQDIQPFRSQRDYELFLIQTRNNKRFEEEMKI